MGTAWESPRQEKFLGSHSTTVESDIVPHPFSLSLQGSRGDQTSEGFDDIENQVLND
jgi:hypothetical protein